MKYYVKTKHQDGNDYVCVETNSVNAALDYATAATEGKAITLIITNEHDDEMCIVFDGLIYQESCFREVVQYANEIEEDYRQEWMTVFNCENKNETGLNEARQWIDEEGGEK